METLIDLAKVTLETNSALWQLAESDGQSVLQVLDNRQEDHIGGKVALIGDPRHNYTMQAEIRFVRHYLPQDRAGWFGFVLRAQDTDNYELVWFMPGAKHGETAAYLAVAHGVVPWWTEAYASQEKAGPAIPLDRWFRARVDVVEDEFSLYVEDQAVFRKKLTYYLADGRPGFYVGTATDAAFRRVAIDDLP
jgi:hypothetical protein